MEQEMKAGTPEQLRTLVSFDDLTVNKRDRVIAEANRLGLATQYALTRDVLAGWDVLAVWSVSLPATPAEIALLEAILR